MLRPEPAQAAQLVAGSSWVATRNARNTRRPAQWAGLICLIASLICHSAAAAAPQESAAKPYFSHLTAEDGLPQDIVTTLFRDSVGYLWIGSEIGLVRYDGQSFERFYYESANPESLSDNYIRDIAEGPDGDIWVATRSGGVSRYQLATSTFVRYRHDPEKVDSLASDRTRSIAVDTQGHVWVGTDDAGLDQLDAQTGVAVHYRSDDQKPASLDSDQIRSVMLDREGSLWVGTLNGLNEMTGPDKFHHYLHANSNGDNRIRSIYQAPSGELLIGTHSGVSQVSISAGYMREIAAVGGARSMLEDSLGRLWVATTERLVMLDAVTGEITEIPADRNSAHGLNRNQVTALADDTSGLIWVGTFGGGLNIWNPNSAAFGNYATDTGVALNNSTVTSFSGAADGGFWVGTLGGLHKLSADHTVLQLWVHETAVPGSLPDNRIAVMQLDGDEQLLVGSMAGGLARLNESEDLFDPVVLERTSGEEIKPGIMSMLKDGRGRVWIGTFGNGLFLMDPQQQNSADQLPIAVDAIVTTVEESTDGSIWLGTEDRGILHLSADGQLLDHWNSDDSALSSNAVYALRAGPFGDIWVGTDRGLNRLIWEEGNYRVESINAAALAGVGIFGIEWVSADQIWLGTNQGIMRLNTLTLETTAFDSTQGVAAREFIMGAHSRLDADTMLFGSLNGYTEVRPGLLSDDAVAPALVLSDLDVSGDRPEGVLRDLDQVRLGWQDDTLSLDFAVLSYANALQHRVEYQVTGLSERWLEAGPDHRITLLKLEPGSYVLNARVNTGTDSASTAYTLSIQVAPPPWATNWAYGGYGALTILLALGGLRMQKTRARHAADRRYRTLVTMSRALIYTHDLDGRILSINPAAASVFGADAEQLVGMKISELIVPSEQAMFERYLEDIQRQGRADGVLHVRGDNGVLKTLAFDNAVYVESGDQPYVLACALDATEVEVAHESLRKTEAQFHAAQKLDSLGTMAAGIAHDFNNLLGAILGHADLAEESLPAKSEALEHVSKIQMASETAAQLTDKLLSYTGQRSMANGPVSISRVVERITTLLDTVISKKAEIKYELERGLPMVQGDTGQITQVVMNLLTNASEALDGARGKIVLQTGQMEVSGSKLANMIGGEDLRPGRYLYLSVTDTGRGMDDELKARIFDPFFTTKFTGRGLGLAAAAGIVRGHGGAIFVDSALEQGSTFTVLLPRTSTRQTSPEPDSVFDNKPRLRLVQSAGATVLVVDDEAGMRTMMRKSLESSGFEVMVAENGREGLALFQAHKNQIRAVVTDMTMPVMDGRELAQAIHESHAQMPIFLVSGYAEQDSLDDEFREILTGYVQKPFRPSALITQIQHALTLATKAA